MKILEFPFKKDGWVHTLVDRKGPIALIRRAKNEVNRHFEVIIIRVVPASVFSRAGKTFNVPEREIYPRPEHWGTYGWTFRGQDFERAKAKFATLTGAA